MTPTLRTTGELRAMAGREARLTATAHGRLQLPARPLVLGMAVKKGEVLATIVPKLDDTSSRVTLSADVRAARAELKAAESELARQERLWEARTIPERQVVEARTRVELARARLQAAQGRLGQFDAGASGRGGAGAFQIRSPIAGSLVAIHAASGQSVEDGEQLFTVVDLSRVWLHADVFEPDIAAAAQATGATFRVDGYDQLFVIEPPDGRVVTIGQLVDEKTRTVPLIFELANPDGKLRIGSFATVFIATGPPVDALAIPESAIVRDAGRPVAYVQVEGESFERRVLVLGVRSGGWVEVRAGLVAGERVVVRGAYDVKLAAAGGAVPEHGHAH
jgi:RND family efflux transporter MFP subunit